MIRSKEEEVINAMTHFLSSIITLAATFIMIAKLGLGAAASFPLFILGLTASWTFFRSFLYHGSFEKTRRERNRVVDISAIYIMIAGSSSGICLASSTSFMSICCCIAIFLIAGILVVKFCLTKKTSEPFLVLSCVLLAWLSIMPSLGLFFPSNFVSEGGVPVLLSGFGAYSVGVVFYIRDRKKWYHTAWHICVSVGFTLHYTATCIALKIF